MKTKSMPLGLIQLWCCSSNQQSRINKKTKLLYIEPSALAFLRFTVVQLQVVNTRYTGHSILFSASPLLL